MPYIKLLIDLDGTLTDTNGDKFDDIKYGRNRKFELHDIPLIEGAVDFIQHVKTLGHSVAIISDSHHAYVERMAAEVFDVPCLSLAKKPNTEKLRAFLLAKFDFPKNTKAKDFLFIGDTELDIHTARRLEIPSVCLNFSYGNVLGNGRANKEIIFKLKEGATYYCKNYHDILEVLKKPALHRLALEYKVGRRSVKFLNEQNRNNGYTMVRCLARQSQGLCDETRALKRYHDFQSATRNVEFVQEIAEDTSSYLREVVCAHPDKFSWDYITCVPDKETTIPPKKMEDFLSAIDTPIPKAQIFAWSPDTEGSIRNQKNRNERFAFVNELISIQKEHSLKDKNVIVIDDQYTTGGTAKALSEKLLNAEVKNILFLSLFYLVSNVPPEIECPRCGKATEVNYNPKDRVFFVGCVAYKDKGAECRWTETIT